ncbi:PAS domain S-box protein [Sphingoaurantiacus capsulatus]|uniref:histidine kinase n=1 Tax=Sphingoaurantiacus capsulatus TaxID=1771310 RepID=A0ABV7X856_9SPHN
MAGRDDSGTLEATVDIFDLVHDSIFVRDRAGYIRSWNAASEALYGWSREAAVGRLVNELLPPRRPERDAAREAELLETGRWEGRLSRAAADGRMLTIDARWSVRRDADGAPVEIIETGRDVTERRAVEEALQRSEYRYRNLFQAMAASFWEIDFTPIGDMLRELRSEGVTDYPAYFAANPDYVRRMIRATRVVDVNEQTVALFGRGDKGELLRDLEPFWPDESLHVFAASVISAVTRKPNYVTETPLRTLDGRVFDALFTAAFPPESIAKGTLLIGVIDISDRTAAEAHLRHSETRYRNLFHHMPIALLQLDMRPLFDKIAAMKTAGVDVADKIATDDELLTEALRLVTIDEVNDAAMKLFGVTDPTALHGPIEPAWQARPDTIRRSLLARLRGEPGYVEETKISTRDGRVVDVLYNIAFPPTLTELGINVVTFMDLTERVETQAALQRVQADFARAARIATLGELTASIAHEVNQPLAAIATNGEASLRWLGRPEPDVEEVHTLTGRMVADARRAADIIKRIRGIATPSAPTRAELSVNALVEEASLFLRHEMQAQGVTLTLDLAAGVPPILGDRTQLQQVLVNLMVNAMQAMAGAGVTRRGIIVRSRAHGTGAALEIEDSGPGFAPEHLGSLFASFFTTKADGMGIGLSICRSIIDDHGGQISAANAPAGGARFHFTLPAEGTP